MKTEELIDVLARGVAPVEPSAPAVRHAAACAAAGLLVAAAAVGLLGVRADLPQALSTPMFWAKLGFAAALVAAGLLATARLSRPGATLRGALPLLALPIGLMWTVAAWEIASTPASARASTIFTDMWTECAPWIVALSLPVFAVTMWSVRRLAPTRLRSAGAAAGLLAGATGALVYSFHCPVASAPFVAVWYLLGMLAPALLGSVLGPRLLRW